MTAALKLPKDRVAALRPEDLQAHLLTRGWQLDPTVSSPDVGVFRFPGELDAEALLPRRRDFADYALRVGDILQILAAVERRSIWEVLNELSPPAPGNTSTASVRSNGERTGDVPVA